MHDFMFGVFAEGKLIFAISRTTCTYAQAAVIVGLLDLGHDALKPNHYFACDYVNNILPGV